MPPKKPNLLDTSQRIYHIFGCDGSFMHLTPGQSLLQTGNATRCPYCGATVRDMTDTPIGQAYFAQARPDLGAQQP